MKNIFRRICAVVLMALFIVNLLPVASAEITGAGIVVNDGETPVANAAVSYAIVVDGTTMAENFAISDSDGVVGLPELANYAAEIASSEQTVTVSCSVSAEGYCPASSSAVIENINQTIYVSMEKEKEKVEIAAYLAENCKVTLSVNGGQEIDITNGSYLVEVGSSVVVNAAVSDEEVYYLNSFTVNGEEKISGTKEAAYSYQAENVSENLLINVGVDVYTYTVTMTVSGSGMVSGGEVTASGTKTATFTAAAGSTPTLLIAPNEGYCLYAMAISDKNGTISPNESDLKQAESDNGEVYVYTLPALCADTSVVVQFVEEETTEVEDPFSNEFYSISFEDKDHKPIDVSIPNTGPIYLEEGAKAIFTPNGYSRISINNGRSSANISITEDTTITSVMVTGLNKETKIIRLKSPIEIVFDGKAPEVSNDNDMAYGKFEADGEFRFRFKVTDDTSGIQSVSAAINGEAVEKLEDDADIYSVTMTSAELKAGNPEISCAEIPITVTAVDNVGHRIEKDLKFTAILDEPTLTANLSTKNNDNKADGNYYTSATVIITVENGGAELNKSGFALPEGISEEKITINENVVTIDLPDGHYMDFSVTYTNYSELESTITLSEEFWVDNKAPNGEIYFITNVSDALVETLTLGLIYTDITVGLKDVKDDYSGVKSVEYKIVVTGTIDNSDNWRMLEEEDGKYSCDITEDGSYVVYFKITDKAGNSQTISTKEEELKRDKTPPEITVNTVNKEIFTDSFTCNNEGEDKYTGNVIYTGDVKFVFSVTDNYAGVSAVKYKINANDFVELEPNSEENYAVELSPANYPENDITLVICATDGAENMSDTTTIAFQMDSLAPRITLPETKEFYNEEVSLSITIEEKNFDPENTSVTIYKDGKVINDKALTWTHDGDGIKYSAPVRFSEDGVYHYKIDCKDEAGNKTSVESKSFTVDRTAPKVSVTYDNNDVRNGKYFNAPRTATIRVEEHNFDPSRVSFKPSVAVTWYQSGDIHTASISYNVDGNYSFDISVTDKADNSNAGINYGKSAAPTSFVIDTTFEEMIDISGVSDGSAYGYDDKLIPDICVQDTNLSFCEITLVGKQRSETIDLSEEIAELINRESTLVTAMLDVFEKDRSLDGIYTLTVKSKDLAENEDEETIKFTVNRYGAVFVYGDYLMELIADGGTYNNEIINDIVVDVYSPVKFKEDQLSTVVTCDGRTIEAVPTIEDVADGGAKWYQKQITLNKSEFADDGIYEIAYTSTDAQKNAVENTFDNSFDLKNETVEEDIRFYVDSTAPQLSSVIGLEERIINATEREVQYTVYDTIGVKSIRIFVDGEKIDEIVDLSEDQSNYSGSFILSEKSETQNVKFVIEDLAGNITDTNDNAFVPAYAFEKEVTVSTNLFVRWYANTGLFWGSVGGIGVIAVAVALIASAKKKKRTKPV